MPHSKRCFDLNRTNKTTNSRNWNCYCFISKLLDYVCERLRKLLGNSCFQTKQCCQIRLVKGFETIYQLFVYILKILSLEDLLTLLLKCIKSDKGSYYPSSKPHNDILNFFGRLTPWRLINVTLNNEIQSEELCKFPLKL